MRRVCFNCADRLSMDKTWRQIEEPEHGDVCAQCGYVYESRGPQFGTWRPRTAIDRLREAIDG